MHGNSIRELIIYLYVRKIVLPGMTVLRIGAYILALFIVMIEVII